MIARWAYFKLQYPNVRQFIRASGTARAVQRDVLFEKIRLAAESAFGRDHGLSSVTSLAEFRRQIPIADYEYIRPYVDRVRAGETSAMFSPQTRLMMFAMTSGTSDKPKYIPITKRFVDQYKHGWKIWALQAHADHLDLLSKEYVHLTSDWQKSSTSSGVWCGSISGLASETRPAIVRKPFIVPPTIAKVDDWKSRQYLALRIAMVSPRVGMVLTANSQTLINLAKLADEMKQTLIKDIFNGTLSSEIDVPDSLRANLERRIQGHRDRGRQLEEIVHRTGNLYPRDFWPELSVVAVWTGGPAGAFVPEVKKLYGEHAFRDHGLSASEGRMTIPLEDDSNAGVLDFTSGYFEFIPIDEYESEDPDVLEAHELQEGASYYILLTNSTGLFRYNIRDVVRCVGFRGEAPLLEFLHKGVHCCNVTGEKLTEYQVAAAVAKGFRSLNRPTETVKLVPVMGNPPGYVLQHEPQVRDYGRLLAEKINANLAASNLEYEDRLSTKRLLPLRLQEMPAGYWDMMRDRRIAERGGSYEQYKHAFLGGFEDDFSDSIGEHPPAG